MVVDPTTSQVFVSCPSSNSVAVLDSSGNLLATIGDIAGASGLAAVGNTVYVTAENTGTVDAINTSTLAANPLGATGLVDATDLVYAGGYLWSTTSDGDQALDEPLYRIDPSSGAVTIYNSLLGAFVDSLLADPGNPNEFLASTSDITFPSAQDITVSSGTPSAGPLVTLFNDGNPLAISPDGSTVFAQDSSNLVGLDSDTLQPNGVQYPAMYLINAVAASSGDGGVIAITNAGISIYRLGNPADMIGSTEWDDNQIVEPDGLAFSPDGMTIFAVTTAPYPPGDNGPPGPAEFHALTTNALPSPPPLINSPPYGENFGSVAVGTVSSQSVILQNSGPGPDSITGVDLSGADPNDFIANPASCGPSSSGVVTLASGAACSLTIYFRPGATGTRSATLTLNDDEITPYSVDLTGVGSEGYYEAGANGAVFAYGDAFFRGDMAKKPLSAPIISMALTHDGGGYWLLGRDGGVFSFGDAGFYGSTGGIALNKPVVGMSPDPDGGGYWLVASDGGIFAFGAAPFYGSTGAIHLNEPIVGMAPTPDGRGYWLVASDGGVFAFGDAGFYGSTGAIHLNEPIVGMAPTPDGRGYWLVASDGGVFAFGDASFYGSTGSIRLNRPMVSMASTPDGGGYWLVANDGGVFAFGDAPFDGSAASTPGQSVVSLISSGPPTVQAILDAPAVRNTLSRFPHWNAG